MKRWHFSSRLSKNTKTTSATLTLQWLNSRTSSPSRNSSIDMLLLICQVMQTAASLESWSISTTSKRWPRTWKKWGFWSWLTWKWRESTLRWNRMSWRCWRPLVRCFRIVSRPFRWLSTKSNMGELIIWRPWFCKSGLRPLTIGSFWINMSGTHSAWRFTMKLSLISMSSWGQSTIRAALARLHGETEIPAPREPSWPSAILTLLALSPLRNSESSEVQSK